MDLTVRQFKSQLCEALSRELEVARRKMIEENTHRFVSGVKTSSSEGSFLYEFEDLQGFPPDEGVTVNFAVKDKSATGRYLGCVDSKFILELDEDLGEVIEEGTATSDPLFLLQKQIELLEQDTPYSSAVALASVGIGSLPDVSSIDFEQRFAQDLNQKQQSALSVVRKSSISFIWGPPGTGKTTTLGSVVAALAQAGKRVLLVSNTNLALDTALEKCADRSSLVQELPEGHMLRLGRMVKVELQEKYAPKIELDLVYEHQAKPLNLERSEAIREKTSLERAIEDQEKKEKQSEKHRLLAVAPEVLTEERDKISREVSTLKKDKKLIRTRVGELEEELKTSESKTGIGRLLSGNRKPGQIRIDLDSERRRDSQLTKSIDRKQERIAEIDDLLPEAERDAKTARKWLETNAMALLPKESLAATKAQVSKIAERIKAIDEELKTLRNKIVKTARVIACTAYRPLLDRDIADEKFDCVVVDEVSMMPLPLYFSSAHRATERVIVAGDFRQLPPVIRLQGYGASKDKDEELRSVLASNPFTLTVMKAGTGSGPLESTLVALSDQYRMREAISEVISSNFYPEHKLKAVNHRTDKSTPWGNETFILFDTSNIGPESGPVNGKSQRNIKHGLVVQALCTALFQDGWDLDGASKKSFGVVSPYKTQAKFIEQLIDAGREGFMKGGVSTVHRFQGNERDLMIIDLTKVTSPSSPALGQFLGVHEALAPENAMWNVAISRARQHVFLVADMQSISRDPKALISRILANLDGSDLRVIDAGSILDLSSLQSRIPKEAKGSISWHSTDGFYRQFAKDLAQVRESVMIVSPFTAEPAINRWIQSFRDLIAKNVKVAVFTKPPEEKADSAEALRMHHLLAEVVGPLQIVPKMHEKLAVIDNQVAWVGSLNILSHGSASEIMLRIQSPDFATSLSKEYLSFQKKGDRGSRTGIDSKTLQKSSPCRRMGCGGTIVEVPAGVSKRTNRSYEAFLSCSRNRDTGCKGA
jgi:superfamily I DNA and/or RNA helicase